MQIDTPEDIPSLPRVVSKHLCSTSSTHTKLNFLPLSFSDILHRLYIPMWGTITLGPVHRESNRRDRRRSSKVLQLNSNVHTTMACIYLFIHSTLSPIYMAEISPPELRGSLTALEHFSIVLGVVFGFWTGFFTRSRTSTFPTTCIIITTYTYSLRLPLLAHPTRGPTHTRNHPRIRMHIPPSLAAPARLTRPVRRSTPEPRQAPHRFELLTATS